MSFLKYVKTKNYQLQLEKLIIGLEEPIFIKGIGNILAKVDSGNGAFNVLHGEDFYRQGETVVFTTFDEEGKSHRISKKIQGTIEINIGAGNTEERPIVLMDIKFANDEYMNVPFTVGNRSNNKNKVLLGKEFLTKELDVLIDVTKDNIADKHIEVSVPVTESSDKEQGDNQWFGSQVSKKNPSGATSGAKKAVQAAKGTISGIYDFIKAFGTPGETLSQKIKLFKKAWYDAKAIVNDYQRSDKEIIFNKLSQSFIQENIPINNFLSNPQIIKILDYSGTDYANNNNLKQDNGSKQVNEATEPNQQQQEQEQQTAKQNNTKQFEKILYAINSETAKILYLVIYDGSKTEEAKQVLSTIYQSISGSFSTIVNELIDAKISNYTNDILRKIVDALHDKDIQSTIVECLGRQQERHCNIMTGLLPFEEQKTETESEAAEEDNSKEKQESTEKDEVSTDKIDTSDKEPESELKADSSKEKQETRDSDYAESAEKDEASTDKIGPIDKEAEEKPRKEYPKHLRVANEWRSIISKLPKNFTEYTPKDRNTLYQGINKLTSGEDKVRVRVPNGYTISKKADPKIRLITADSDGNYIIKRVNGKKLDTYRLKLSKGKYSIHWISSSDARPVKKAKNSSTETPSPQKREVKSVKKPLKEKEPIQTPEQSQVTSAKSKPKAEDKKVKKPASKQKQVVQKEEKPAKNLEKKPKKETTTSKNPQSVRKINMIDLPDKKNVADYSNLL